MSIQAAGREIPERVARLCRRIGCDASEAALLAKYYDEIVGIVSGDRESIRVDVEELASFCRLMAKLRIAVRCPRDAAGSMTGVDVDDADIVDFG